MNIPIDSGMPKFGHAHRFKSWYVQTRVGCPKACNKIDLTLGTPSSKERHGWL